jgi:membrane-associated phospholipid phosphatase
VATAKAGTKHKSFERRSPAFLRDFFFIGTNFVKQTQENVFVMKKILFLIPVLIIGSFVSGQTDSLRIDSVERHVEIVPPPVVSTNKVYQMKPAVDLPLTVVGTGWSLYAFTKIYNKDTSTTLQILALDKNDISPFNRRAVENYSATAQHAGDIMFYGAMPLPVLLLLDKKIRRDGVKYAWLYLESMSVTGLLYTSAVYFHDKYRPYAYNPEVSMSKKKGGGAKNSFYAGHVALVGTSTFFVAKTYTDYHPGFKPKWLLFGLAGAATAATGYCRFEAGQHFPTDILIGAIVGPLSGLLVPHLHKVKDKEPRLSMIPYYGKEKGIVMTWKLSHGK